jgi:hypothetical protein
MVLFDCEKIWEFLTIRVLKSRNKYFFNTPKGFFTGSFSNIADLIVLDPCKVIPPTERWGGCGGIPL